MFTPRISTETLDLDLTGVKVTAHIDAHSSQSVSGGHGGIHRTFDVGILRLALDTAGTDNTHGKHGAVTVRLNPSAIKAIREACDRALDVFADDTERSRGGGACG